MKKRRFNFSGIIAIVVAILVLAIVIPINLIANYNDKSFDMTPTGLYTLSDITTDLLDETSDKDIEVYFLWDLQELGEAEGLLPLYHTLIQLDERDNIKVTDFMADENPALVEDLNQNGTLTISNADIVVRCGDITKHIPSSRIFPADDEGITKYAGEELITSAIKVATGGNLPTIYFMTGHSQITIHDNYSPFASALKADNYAVDEFELSTIDAVPDNAAIVILSSPVEDITDDEKEKLLEYADNGGNLAFFLPPVDNGRFMNIEEVLAYYEIGMDYNVVHETLSDYILYNVKNELDPYTFGVSYPEFSSDGFTEDLTTAINILVENGAVPAVSNTRSFFQFSTENSEFVEKSPIVKNFIDQSTGIASTISEPFGGDAETFEAASKLSELELELAFYSFNKASGSKLIVFGTDDMLNMATDTSALSTTKKLALTGLTWMHNSDVNMEIGNKGAAFDYMSFPNAEAATSTMRIFTIVPFVIAAIGLLVWLKRRHS